MATAPMTHEMIAAGPAVASAPCAPNSQPEPMIDPPEAHSRPTKPISRLRPGRPAGGRRWTPRTPGSTLTPLIAGSLRANYRLRCGGGRDARPACFCRREDGLRIRLRPRPRNDAEKEKAREPTRRVGDPGPQGSRP